MTARIEVIQADISTLAVDAIVNAANAPLMMGGGVDGAIRRKAGREMEDDLRRIGRCKTGTAIITRGYRLPAKFVIHTVAPMWGAGGATEQRKTEQLAGCYRAALKLADQHGVATIAFPAIGTGIYHWPVALGAQIALHEVRTHLAGCEMQVKVMFCCYSEADQAVYDDLVGSTG